MFICLVPGSEIDEEWVLIYYQPLFSVIRNSVQHKELTFS